MERTRFLPAAMLASRGGEALEQPFWRFRGGVGVASQCQARAEVAVLRLSDHKGCALAGLPTAADSTQPAYTCWQVANPEGGAHDERQTTRR